MANITEKIEQLLEPIAQDNTSGASELARRSAVALLDLLGDLNESPNATITAIHQPLLQFAKRLLQSQPKMATLFNLVNRALLLINANRDFGEARSAVEKYIYNYLAVVVGGADSISQQFQPLIVDSSIVLVHSYSATVSKALINAKRNGKRFEVICTESRPMMEGRKMASLLAAAGIPVTFMLDAAAALALQRATMVLVGADAITNEGVVNKIGTTMIALTARAHNRPCYVLCDSTKLLPSNYKLLNEEIRPAQEVWPDVPDNILIISRYFETVPLEYLTAVITEHGILRIPEVKLHLTNLGISSELCAEL